MRRLAFALLAPAAVACGPRRPQPTPPVGVAAAALDSATARRLCARPDSVLAAGWASCELRDQRPPIKVF
jgi:hypothetical protein